MTSPILELLNVESNYGPVQALRGVSLVVPEGQIVAVLGANGAGKTTTLKTISGIIEPRKGQVKFRGQDIQKQSPDRIVRAGVAHVPEGREVFPLLNVEDNLRMGAWVFRRDTDRLRRQLERVYATFPALADKRRARAGELSGGQGRMLSVAREMMTEPQLLLVDEPTAGLAPNLVEQVYDILLTAKKSSGVAILLVEQNVEQALPLADHIYLLNLGRVKAEGPGREFDNQRVRALIQECLLG